MRKIMGWRWTFFISGLIVMSLGITMSIKGKLLAQALGMSCMLGYFKILG